MLTIVNENLINTFITENEQREGSYIAEFYPNAEITQDPEKEQEKRRLFPIFKIFSDGENYEDFSLRVDSRLNDNGKVNISGKAFRSNRDADDENIVIAAIPYVGTIKPMEEDPRYEILKAVFMPRSTTYSIKHGRFSYNKVVYLVIRLKDTSENFNIPIEWYSRYRNKDMLRNDDDNHKWNRYLLEIRIDDGFPLILEDESGTVQPVEPNREVIEHDMFDPSAYIETKTFPVATPQLKAGGLFKKNGAVPGNLRRRSGKNR